jgi:hypothetical protein
MVGFGDDHPLPSPPRALTWAERIVSSTFLQKTRTIRSPDLVRVRVWVRVRVRLGFISSLSGLAHVWTPTMGAYQGWSGLGHVWTPTMAAYQAVQG